MQRRDDDDEALEPHADVDDERNDEEQHHVHANLLDPQQLRCQAIAENQRPVELPVRSAHAVAHHVHLVRVGAVPGHERLDHVAVGDDQARNEQDLRHVVQVALGDEVLQPIDRSNRNRERQHHREPRVDGARDEVRREDRGVPSRDRRRQRSRSSRSCAPTRPAASRARRAADTLSRSGASDGPSRAIPSPARRRSRVRLSIPSDRAASRGRESIPRTRTAARRSRTSRPQTRPRPAGCGTAATRPSCSDTGTASRWRATAGRCAESEISPRTPRRTASSPPQTC